MKRDMELIRRILFLAEENLPLSEIDGVEAEVIAEHAWLLHCQGFVEATFIERSGKGRRHLIHADIVRINWSGHELIRVLRRTPWEEFREHLKKESMGSVSRWLIEKLGSMDASLLIEILQ